MLSNNRIKVLDNFIKGKYTYNEYLQVKEWFNNIHNYEEIKRYLSEHWNEINRERKADDKSLEHIYQNIEYQILLEERNEAKKRKFWNIYRQVAAILLIPVLAFAVYNYMKKESEPVSESGWVEINSPEGARTEFMLPDGSKGWLNSGSKLRYTSTYSRSRVVELSGEAFFDVTPQKSVFTVSIEDLYISVYGTKFNVTAYPGEDLAEVILESGSVKVTGKRSNLENTLIPDQKLTYMPADNKYSLRQVNTKIYTSWKEGYLMMDNETFEQAAKRMAKWYNVDIIIEDEILKNYRFKATFQDEPIEEVLRLMALTTPMDYEIKKRVACENDIYKKKEVRLRIKDK
ncbi:MAG: DUF4974 domain-containing protein [Bacteroidales bacterium]|nr:DUF4974 domain-containing protein [Bacteroidales bacterium]